MRVNQITWTQWVMATVAFMLPAVHPLLRPLVGMPSHLLWFVHALPVAIMAYRWGLKGAILAILASAALVGFGERSFGHGYGVPADEATIMALMIAVGITSALVAGFAISAKAEETLRREVQAALLQSQKIEAIGRLAGGVAHDFKNLLAIILGTTELLLSNAPPEDSAQLDDLTAIQSAARSAAKLTSQLLAFSRQQKHAPQILDVGAVLREMTGMLQRVIGEGVTLTLDLAAADAHALADATQVEQVVMNLVVNARDAMPAGGRIAIRLEHADLRRAGEVDGLPPGPYVTLSVQDTGEGMDAETRAKAFEPFFTTKPSGKGTGLGLATVFGIVRQANGGIVIASERGAGTRMTVYLPRVPAADVPTVQPSVATKTADRPVAFVA